ncbi:tRNA (guanine(26)-N(2))-dimethyltransferase-like [Eurosta solidaginis]|uniref:tRNA (guanine(26)-N(2))-dimethyltransferase-like n=1 Tax=Eurosta solidaginis TaxID=178769 RepID=UPI003530B7CD
MVFQCTGCDTYTLQPMGIVKSKISDKGNAEVKFGIPTGPNVNTNCAHCGDKHHMGGPLWSHPIHDPTFVEELLQIIEEKPLSDLDTQRRLKGVLSAELVLGT